MRRKKRPIIFVSTPTGPGADWIRSRFFDDEEEWEEDDDEFYDEDEEGPSGQGYAESDEEPPESVGVNAIFTGLLNADGKPIIRHPVRIRCGFFPEERKYHTPTMDDDADGSGSVVGWAYEV